MTNEIGAGHGPRLWRIALWGAAAAFLLLPAAAMQFTAEMSWGLGDFVIWGFMLLAACGAVELSSRTSGAYRVAVAVAAAAAFLLVWINLAVGMIGDEGNPANLMFAGVIAVALIGAALARGRARGLADAMSAAAFAQALAGIVALAFGWGARSPLWPWHILAATIVFSGLWLLSAELFRRAARAGP